MSSSSELPPDSWDFFEEIGQDPDSESSHDCDCGQLTQALEPDEVLPGHVCLETARATTRLWFQRQVVKLTGHVELAETVVPTDSPEEMSSRLPVGYLLHRESMQWPLPYDGRHIGIVINQWAEGDPSKTLANLLAKDQRWQREVRQMRQLYEFLLATRADDSLTAVTEFLTRVSTGEAAEGPPLHLPDPAFLGEWLQKAGWSTSKNGRVGHDAHAVGELAGRLRRHGLPYNPSILRHLRAVAAGMEKPLPAPGLLVTSLIYVGVDQDGIVWCRQNPEINVEGSETAGPLTLFRPVQTVAKRHREFVRQFATHPFADLSTLRRVQPGSASYTDAPVRSRDVTIDYVEEALNCIEELRRLAKGHPNGTGGAINEYLDRVQRRVGNRRRRRGLPAGTPAGWRDQLRSVLQRSIPADALRPR